MSSTISPCNSNDSRNDYSNSIEPCTATPSSPSFYSCLASDAVELIDGPIGATSFVVEFDYEIHTPLTLGEDLMEGVILDFQNDLAGGVADFYGVRDCKRAVVDDDDAVDDDEDDAMDGSGNRRDVRRVLGNKSPRNLGKYSEVAEDDGYAEDSPIVGCASTPDDAPDDNISLCVNEVTLSEESNCTPMRGYLTIYTDNNSDQQMTQEEIESETFVAIQRYLRTSTTDYLSDNVLAVSFIGTRDLVPVGIMNPDLLLRPMIVGGGNRNLDSTSSTSSTSSSNNLKSLPVSSSSAGPLMSSSSSSSLFSSLSPSALPLANNGVVVGSSVFSVSLAVLGVVTYFKRRRHVVSSGKLKRQNSLPPLPINLMVV